MTDVIAETAGASRFSGSSIAFVNRYRPVQDALDTILCFLKMLCRPAAMGKQPFDNPSICFLTRTRREPFSNFLACPDVSYSGGDGIREIYRKNRKSRQSICSHWHLKRRYLRNQVRSKVLREVIKAGLDIGNEFHEPSKLSRRFEDFRREQRSEDSHLSITMLALSPLRSLLQMHSRCCNSLCRPPKAQRHEAYKQRCRHGSDRYGHSQRIPPHYAIVDPQRTATKNSIQPCHSLIPRVVWSAFCHGPVSEVAAHG